MAKYQWNISCHKPDFNGTYWGVEFQSGIARVRKKYYADLLSRKGCTILERHVVDPNWNPEKILVIRLGAYGDNLMVTTAIRGLRNKFPDAKIHFYGHEPHHMILYNNPDLDSIIKAPIQDIGHIIDDYDEAYDLIEHIEHNPQSDFKNAYRLAEERLEVTDYITTQEDSRPVFIPTQEEIAEAQHILTAYGFGPNKNKLILIHAESSSIIRRMSINTAMEISQHFIKKGYKILFAGHDQATPNMEFQKCKGCSETIAAEITGGNVGIQIDMACPHCKYHNTITKTNRNKDIFFLHELLGKVSARVIFTMQKFVDLVLGVDSAHSHIAAALDIPSVVIYGPIDPKLRQARGYNKQRVIYKPLKCGPCHQLSPYCVIYPKGPPPCITQFIAEDIIPEAELALEGDFSLHPDKHKTRLIKIYNPKDVRNCPVCDERDFEVISRKGEWLYYQLCHNCHSIFLDEIPNLGKVYDPNYIAVHDQGDITSYYKSFARTLQQVADVHKIDGRDYLDVGCGEGNLLDEMGNLGWKAQGVDRKRPTCKREGAISTSLDYLKNQFDLVSMIHVIEHVEEPKEFLRATIQKVKEGGVFFLYGHDAATYPRNNAWLPINTKVVGEHLQIITRAKINEMLEDLGLKILQSRTVNNLDFIITASKGL